MSYKFYKKANALIAELQSSIHQSEVTYWTYLVLALFASITASYILRIPIKFLLLFIFRKIAIKERELFITKLIGPLQIFVAILCFLFANFLFEGNQSPKSSLIMGIKVAFFLAVTYLVYRLLDLIFERAIVRHKTFRSKIGLVLPLGRRIAKTVLIITALLFLLAQFGIDVSALLLGLGVGSLAIALAAQKILENLFGGAVLSLDQPFQVGDYCQCGDILGYIEEIGIRSTRIRTLDRTLVSIPNSVLSQMNIENYNEREKIRLYNIIRLELETKPEQIKAVLEQIELLILKNTDLFYNDIYRVRLMGLSELGYDIEIYAFAKTTEFIQFTAIREKLFFDILNVLSSMNIKLAIPERYIRTK